VEKIAKASLCEFALGQGTQRKRQPLLGAFGDGNREELVTTV